MNVIRNVKSGLRFAVNEATRALIWDESLRKRLAECYYAWAARRVNAREGFAARSASDLLDWRATMGFRFKCSREVYRANSFYGIGEALRTFSGAQGCIKACVEHGVHFGSYVNGQELEGSGLPCLITFSPARLEHIRVVSDVPVAMVGPYIAYAPDYLDEIEMSKVRDQLGRTLLVFPSHSVDRVKVTYELASLVSEIERVKREREINSVLICLYYRDLLNGVAGDYESLGYRVVTAGYREDALFLARQRSLIFLADLTMSNSVGTQVGYCGYLGRPHYIFDQEKRYGSDSALDDSEFNNAYARSQAAEKAEVAAEFSVLTDSLTGKQRELLERYWGFSKVRSRDELSDLFAVCEEAYRAGSKARQRSLRSNPRLEQLPFEV